MPRKPKKFDPPKSIWIVFDLDSPGATPTYLEEKDLDKFEPFDGEVIVKYVLPVAPKRRAK